MKNIILVYYSISSTYLDKDNLDNKLSKIDIVIGGDQGQGKFRNISKYIMKDKEGYNKYSCDQKCTYTLHQRCI